MTTEQASRARLDEAVRHVRSSRQRPVLLVLGLLLLVAPGVLRAADGEDIVGIYWDVQGVSNYTTTTEPWQPVTGYVVIHNLSSSTGFRTVGVTGHHEGRMYSFCWSSLIGPQDMRCDMYWLLQAAPPQPQSDAIAIVRLWFFVPSPQDVVLFYLGPADYPPWEHDAIYDDNSTYPGHIRVLHPSSGSFDSPVAMVNGTVPVESMSWSEIKALYDD